MPSRFELRTYAFIDRMQPQYAAFLGSELDGDVPLARMAELWIEMSPGSEVYNLLDSAVKSTTARPGLQLVEREFGVLEIHSPSVDQVREAGDRVLEACGLSISDRLKPQVVSSRVVTNVNPYQAQLMNKWRKGIHDDARASLFVIEVAPAAYIAIAANEAEKAANITVIQFRPVGRFGRMFLSGTESGIGGAQQAAQAAIEGL